MVAVGIYRHLLLLILYSESLVYVTEARWQGVKVSRKATFFTALEAGIRLRDGGCSLGDLVSIALGYGHSNRGLCSTSEKYTQSMELEFFISVHLLQLSGVSGKFGAGANQTHAQSALPLSQVPV